MGPFPYRLFLHGCRGTGEADAQLVRGQRQDGLAQNVTQERPEEHTENLLVNQRIRAGPGCCAYGRAALLRRSLEVTELLAQARISRIEQSCAAQRGCPHDHVDETVSRSGHTVGDGGREPTVPPHPAGEIGRAHV